MEMLFTGTEPTRAHDDDAGLDLYVSGAWTIPPGAFVDVDLDVAIKSPPGCWVLLTGRSSTLRRRGLMVNQGVIDPGYIGPLFAGVWNMTGQDVRVEHGERLAQLIVLPNMTEKVRLREVLVLPATERGEKGFGSSGR